jgi:hypothetical protein
VSNPDPAVYRKAADVIREGGLAKGVYGTDGGQHCLVGAMFQAKQDLHLRVTADAEARYLAELLGLPGRANEISHYGVAVWNDAPERRPEDVITLLEQAAEKLEADR